MKILKTTFLLIIALVAIAYLSQFLWPKYEETIPEIDTTALQPLERTQITTGVEKLTYTYKNGKAAVLTIYKLDPTKIEFATKKDQEAGDILSWMTNQKEATLIANGFYFHEDKEPSGEYRQDNTKSGHEPFDQDKSLFVQLKPDLQLIDTNQTPLNKITATHGAQTFPWLIKDGIIKIQKDSKKQARRTLIATDKQGNNYIGAILHNNISLFQLANLLQTTEINWQSAANLDGGPSTGIMYRQDGKIKGSNSMTPIPNVIIVTKKQEK